MYHGSDKACVNHVSKACSIGRPNKRKLAADEENIVAGSRHHISANEWTADNSCKIR